MAKIKEREMQTQEQHTMYSKRKPKPMGVKPLRRPPSGK